MCANRVPLAAVWTLPLLLSLVGCGDLSSSERQPEYVEALHGRAGLLTQEQALAIADREAEKILAEFNDSEHGKELVAKGYAGPFSLGDYRKKVSREVLSDRPAFMVYYSYRPTETSGWVWLGHPMHFAVWVRRDTGETSRFLGA